ncbi:Protein YIP4 [Taphrina deformans PYCC 5710]|uniref:Protein YIP n=1 Tax=Taphrina deformans (strain PYCC 5710 / ATCC 11124 / CBS 356.35 / IMI 108563 / JCM 9778 / NBRC 8474) TaxID=1097556 RepID=R4XC72_TAPDE|nr:Protein YIP4 [Taphrina deformans PYCC 5710]|eukprot:CCG83160.1 Protein YIP4 [Taphrina deformans PYCC 5710]
MSGKMGDERLLNDMVIEPDESDDEADERELLNRLDPMTASTTPQSSERDPIPVVTSISSQNISDRRYTGQNTLDEPVSVTILNDVKAIGNKLKFVLWPAGDARTNEWDLWGPLIFCLMLSLALSFAAQNDQSIAVFTGIFSLIWLGETVCTLNLRLLGSQLAFLQSVCCLGYSLFPLVIAATVSVFVHTALVRVPLTIVMYAWSTYASFGVLQGADLGSKKLLAVYPLTLFYFVLAWTVFISG